MVEALEAIPFECFLGAPVVVVALLLFLFRKHSLPWRFRARVTYVCDGDSIWVKTWYGRRVKLRLLGIDAPETEQAFGGMSQIILARMIEGRRIDVAAVDRDIYGRYVSALLCDGEDVCLRMIERGAAWPYFHYFNRMPRDVAQTYRHAYEVARRDRVGLWQEENPEAPWNWRKRHRSWWTRFVFWLRRVLVEMTNPPPAAKLMNAFKKGGYFASCVDVENAV